MNKRFTQIIDKNLHGIRNASTLHKRILHTLEGLGFDGFDIIKCNNTEIEPLLTTIPEEVFIRYETEGLDQNDIITDYINNNGKPIFQSDAFRLLAELPFDIGAKKQASQVERLLGSVGINNTYSIPSTIKDSNKKMVLSVYSTGSSSEALVEKVKQVESELSLLTTTISRFQETLPSSFFSPYDKKEVLTSRQIEVLRVLAKHSTSQKDAARFLGISTSTIEKHCSAAVAALNAVSVNNAIYIASTQLKLI